MRHPTAEVRSAPSPQSLRSAVLQAAESEQDAGWAYFKAITDFVDAQAWIHCDFGTGERTREAWEKTDLRGRYTRTAVVRIVNTVHAIRKLPLPERIKYYAAPPWNVVEALSSETPAEAMALIESGKTQSEIRGIVQARRDRKESGTPVQREQWVSLEMRLPTDLARRWEGVLNLFRFRLHRPTPAFPQVLEALITDVEQTWAADTDPAALEHTTSDGVELRWSQEQVAAGEIRCRMCGSWNAAALQPHHIIPRSHELACCGPGHPKPIVLLCGHPCHSSIKDGGDGDWATWAMRWGFGTLAKAHGGRI